MALIRPTLFYNFAESQSLDQRLAFNRASAGSYADRLGVLRYRPAGAPRFWSTASDGSPGGLLLEDAATNLLLWSEDFTNAVWTNVASTLSANSLTAPDGNATADLVSAIGSTSALSQAVTVPASNNVAFSVFACASASNFLSLSLNDGTNVVTAWFNLAAGTTGATLPGAGSLVLQASSIQAWGGGWYRCGVQAAATNAGLTASLSPCAADGTAPTAGNAAGVWGAMLTAEGAVRSNSRQSSYIGTTSVTVTRAADNCPLPYSRIDASHFNPNEGTFFFDWMVPVGTWHLFSAPWLGSSFMTGSDYIMTGFTIGNGGIGRMQLACVAYITAGSVIQCSTAPDYPPFTFETPIKVACRYSRTATLGVSVSGRAVASSTTVPAVMPVLPTNFTFFPFNGWAVNNAILPTIIRRFLYFPRYLSADQMQQLTA